MVMADKKTIPAPNKAPELYDDYDFPPGEAQLGEGYRDRTTPAHVKAAIEKRRAGNSPDTAS